MSKKLTAKEMAMRAEHWRRTKRATWVVLAIWAFFSIVVHIDAKPLNVIDFLGFPFGYWFAVQGSLLSFVLIIFMHNRAQDRIDRECGLADDDEDKKEMAGE